MSRLDAHAASIGALGDTLRRDLYLYVCAQPHAVSRDEAAEALDLPLHKAKFHLDRLEAAGLLTTEYARLTGRTGPGAGRPAKLYRRADADIAVSLPGREYEIAGRLLAAAIATSARTGESAVDALRAVAAQEGRAWATTVTGPGAPLELAEQALAAHAYEPRREEHRVVLANCPFHSLAAEHTELVCDMNLALVGALADGIETGAVECRLDPADDRCCVVLASRV